MNFNEYQQKSQKFATYPKLVIPATDLGTTGHSEVSVAWTYPCLGLAGEVGELSEKFKKCLRDKDGKVSYEDKILIIKELGDVLWYIAAIAKELNVPLEEVAEVNIKKLTARLEQNCIKGSGDTREEEIYNGN